MKMIKINSCGECVPYYDKSEWFLHWCAKLEKQVDPSTIHPECPLDDVVVSLVEIKHDMRFAHRVRPYITDYGIAFDFLDSTGHLHGQFRVGDPISSAPQGSIGAVKINDKWFFVVSDAK